MRHAHFFTVALGFCVGLQGPSDAYADIAPPRPATKPAAAAPVASNRDAAALVLKVQGLYDKTTSFMSPFTQDFTATLHNKKVHSAGTVVFAKPGKMLFDYKDPAGNRVVSDGATLRVYDASAKQMYEQAVDKAQYAAALGFLVGGSKLQDTFKFQAFDGASMSFPGGSVLVGTPIKDIPSVKKLLLYVDDATSQVRRVLVVDGQGNKNRFDFTAPRVNEPVTEDSFRFTPPAGTNLVKP